MNILTPQSGTPVHIAECEEFADARAIIAAFQPGTGVFYAHVQPGTRPVREVGEATEGDRAAMAALTESVKVTHG